MFHVEHLTRLAARSCQLAAEPRPDTAGAGPWRAPRSPDSRRRPRIRRRSSWAPALARAGIPQRPSAAAPLGGGRWRDASRAGDWRQASRRQSANPLAGAGRQPGRARSRTRIRPRDPRSQPPAVDVPRGTPPSPQRTRRKPWQLRPLPEIIDPLRHVVERHSSVGRSWQCGWPKHATRSADARSVTACRRGRRDTSSSM